MKKVISLFLSIVLFLYLTPVSAIASENVTETRVLYFTDADFWQNKWDFRVHIVLYEANLNNETFSGKFYVDNGESYEQDVSGHFYTGNIFGSGSDYEYHIAFSVPNRYGGNYVLDFSNSLGNLQGTADGFDQYGYLKVLLEATSMNGPSNSSSFIKVRTKGFDVEDLKLCMRLADSAYEDNTNKSLKIFHNSTLDNNIYSYWENKINGQNYNNIIPQKLKETIDDERLESNVQNNHSNVLSLNYSDDNKDNAAYTVARRENDIDGDEIIDNIDIFVIIRGTYKDEWQGNTEITGEEYLDGKEEHDNFYKAENEIKKGIYDYYHEMRKTYSANQINLIITGHSRGAAVANIYAKEATDAISGKQISNMPEFNSVTAYTFACPNVHKYYNGMELYSNIFNYCFYEDIVPNVPLTNPTDGWGYWKFGKTYNYTLTNSLIDFDGYNAINLFAPTEIQLAFAYWKNVDEYYNKRLYPLNPIPIPE